MATSTAERRRERLAWRVVLASFVAFLLLVGTIPFGVRWYLSTAIGARSATLEIIRGTVLYLQAGSRQEINASQSIDLNEGDQIRTAQDSQALLSLPDGSNVRLWPGSTLQIVRLRSSRYNNRTADYVFRQKAGRSRFEVAPPSADSRTFTVHTPHATALLREGSYGVQVGAPGTEISVRIGSAIVSAQHRTVEVLHNERTAVAAGEEPESPLPAARNYVENGDFAEGLRGWQSGNRNVEDGIPGEISIVEQDERSIVRLLRRDSTKHAETYVHQNLDRDVSDLTALKIALQLKVLHQSLSGGGWVGSEYPFTIRLRYRDANGSENTWIHGFFIQNDEGRPTTHGQRIEPDTWVQFTADVFNPNQVYPRPAHLLWLELEASGWEYESMVTAVQLVGE